MTLTAPAAAEARWWPTPPPPRRLPHYGIGFVAAIRRGFGKYATFDGRASLSEYWLWFLFRALTAFGIAAIGTATILVTGGVGNQSSAGHSASVLLGYALDGFLLATFVPNLAIVCRRLHDTGRTAAWSLIGFVPILGTLILICLLAERTTTTAYRYGPPFIMIDPYRPGWTPQYAPPES